MTNGGAGRALCLALAMKGVAVRYLAVLLVTVTMPALLAQSSSNYHITQTYVLGGDGGWDYVIPDPPQHRVFIGR